MLWEERDLTVYADFLKKKKEALGWTTQELADRSGVPVGTINKILRGETRSPRYDTMDALEDALGKAEKQGLFVRETASCIYGRGDKLYTLEDYYDFPEDVRVELIDGKVFYLEAPATIHQMAVSSLVFQSKRYILEKGGTCVPLPSPVDVQLDCDEFTMVQPDFLIVCDRDKITKKCICGAPDFVAEILSLSSRWKDANYKMRKYLAAGVREYWIVDLEGGRVICYFKGDDYLPSIYGMNQEIPVKIFDGELKITFETAGL